jgi:4-alpha-glucanotransferase
MNPFILGLRKRVNKSNGEIRMQRYAYHNSHDVFFRSPFGAVTCCQKIVIRIQIESNPSFEACYLCLWENGKEKRFSMVRHLSKENIIDNSSRKHEVFETEYVVPDNPGLVWYYFILRVGSRIFYYGNNPERLGGEGKVWEVEPPAYQITVYESMFIPAWYREGIMYQIYVDRFFNGNENQDIKNAKNKALIHADWYDTPFYIKDEEGKVTRWNFFGGNLLGVIKKLPYLKELGISIIYFNPIFESPSNHKYDTADYKKIDPMYGDAETFELLIKEAKHLEISILLDGVFSHTGSDSIYFNKEGNYPSVGAYQSENSPYYSWYKWKEKREYTCWWGVESLPEVNEFDPAYQEFIYQAKDSVINTWMKKGVRGWRLDVADELPDEFIKRLRLAMKKVDPDSILIGEVWEDASNKVSYGELREYFLGKELDSTMNYPFREIFLSFLLGKIDAEQVHQGIMSLYENYPRENFYAVMNLIGSHDRARVLTLLGDAPSPEKLTPSEQESFKLSPEARTLAIQRLKLLTLVQMSFPGVPCIYYGDEAGLEGYTDPFNRATYPWGKEDSEILHWYKRVLRYRQEYGVLKRGDFFSFSVGKDVYGFKRVTEEEEIICLINRNLSETQEIELTFESDIYSQVIDIFEGKLIGLSNKSNNSVEHVNQVGQACLILPPLTGKALLYQKVANKKGSKFPHIREKLNRSCGVLMHISSLPSPWGIGDFGKEAYQFVDFLVESGQSLWQVLPLNPVGLGFSPYQSDSAFAGNPLFISIDQLIEVGLLSQEEVNSSYKCNFLNRIKEDEFERAKCLKTELLHLAQARFYNAISKDGQGRGKNLYQELPQHKREGKEKYYLSQQNYHLYLKENDIWLRDYALYKCLKSLHNDLSWYEWENPLAFRESNTIKEIEKRYTQEIEYHTFVQYTFEYQWQSLKAYANEKGIQIIGDMPIFVATDSCDTWVNRELFVLDERNRPLKVAGVPPDYFSKTGQLWGNPVYSWEALEASDYSWWKLRFKQALMRYDVLRLDHFRGFESYWEVPAGEKTAVNGKWIKGPGKRFFERIISELEPLPLIAEDLGIITPEVNVLKLIFGFPGMKVLQFNPLEEFNKEPQPECVYYTGTHDNDTLLGWYKSEQNHQKIRQGNLAIQKEIEALYQCDAAWVIIPLQDILGLDRESRMNTPGTIEGNWQWRVENDSLTPEIREWLQNLAMKYKRIMRK